METSDLIAVILVIVHSIGLFLFIVNSTYLLRIGESLGTALLCKSEQDFEDSDKKRCCKVSSSKACSLVLFYHLVLIAVDLIVAIVSFTDAAFWNEDDIYFNVVFDEKPMDVGTVLFFAASVNYIVLMLYMIPFVLLPLARKPKRINNIGKLVTYNMFSFYNFLVFWGLIYIIIYCRKSDLCDELPSAFQIIGRQYGDTSYRRRHGDISHLAVILLVIVYVIMLVEAWVLKQYIIVSPFGNRSSPIDEVSKDEAVVIMKNKMKEAPYIAWTIRCPGENQCCDSSMWTLNISLDQFCASDIKNNVENTVLWIDMNHPKSSVATDHVRSTREVNVFTQIGGKGSGTWTVDLYASWIMTPLHKPVDLTLSPLGPWATQSHQTKSNLNWPSPSLHEPMSFLSWPRFLVT